jgi:hypothetical protein
VSAGWASRPRAPLSIAIRTTYGSRPIQFAHDEVRSIFSATAWRLSEIMRDVMRWICPDYADAAEAEPTAMLAWNKSAAMIMHRGELALALPWCGPSSTPC